MTPKLFHGYPILNYGQVGLPELQVVWRELEKVLDRGIPGDIVEFGCYIGSTSIFIRRLLDQKGQSDKRAFHVYDSFQGLPPKSREDESVAGDQFQGGALSISKKEFLHQFQIANLRPPVVHKGWFGELAGKDVPEQIAFAFLDGDFYGSIMDSLKLVWPRMAQGGIVLVDDCGREALPGADRAVRDFFGQKFPAVRQEHNIGIIKA